MCLGGIAPHQLRGLKQRAHAHAWPWRTFRLLDTNDVVIWVVVTIAPKFLPAGRNKRYVRVASFSIVACRLRTCSARISLFLCTSHPRNLVWHPYRLSRPARKVSEWLVRYAYVTCTHLSSSNYHRHRTQKLPLILLPLSAQL